jgi:pyruvate formate lyase activating enzyme
MTAAYIVERATRLEPFFEHSGGGITLTGGEVTLQSEFAEAVLAGCRAEGIHTIIETCGACSWERLARLAQHTDLVLYDLKLVDEAAHRRWTGATNARILDNARQLAEDGVPTVVRVPLIPGITDTAENVRDVFGFMRKVGLARVALLPYNTSAGAKYEWLDRRYDIDAETQDDEALGRIVEMGRGLGMEIVID